MKFQAEKYPFSGILKKKFQKKKKKIFFSRKWIKHPLKFHQLLLYGGKVYEREGEI